jgi:hypothetical protein
MPVEGETLWFRLLPYAFGIGAGGFFVWLLRKIGRQRNSPVNVSVKREILSFTILLAISVGLATILDVSLAGWISFGALALVAMLGFLKSRKFKTSR